MTFEFNGGYFILFIIIIIALWTLAKKIRASAVVGKKVSIAPIRQNSKLEPFLTKLGQFTKSETMKENDVWLELALTEPISIGGIEYSHLRVQPKKPDDNVNKKKAVVCTIKAVELYSKKEVFVDFGMVKALDA